MDTNISVDVKSSTPVEPLPVVDANDAKFSKWADSRAIRSFTLIENGCKYQYRRGEDIGKYCNKRVDPGKEYCNMCLKTPRRV